MFQNSEGTYIELLPKEIRDILGKYLYGEFYIRTYILRNGDNRITIRLVLPILNKSDVSAILNVSTVQELRFVISNYPSVDRVTLDKDDNVSKSSISIQQREIIIGDYPVIELRGIDADIFISKLKQLYNELVTKRYILGIYQYY
jgi:hypothetical protein